MFKKLTLIEEYKHLKELQKKYLGFFSGEVLPPSLDVLGNESLSTKSLEEICFEYLDKTRKEQYFTNNDIRCLYAIDVIKSFLRKNGKALEVSSETGYSTELVCLMVQYLNGTQQKEQVVEAFRKHIVASISES